MTNGVRAKDAFQMHLQGRSSLKDLDKEIKKNVVLAWQEWRFGTLRHRTCEMQH
jgi:hypothetical protein